MNVYGELAPMSMSKKTTQSGFRGKIKYIAKVNKTNKACPNQHICTKLTYDLRNHVIVLGAVNTTFNLNMESTDKTCC